nr:MAG TPA: hypothetical protein [Caudoviricetes sp.]
MFYSHSSHLCIQYTLYCFLYTFLKYFFRIYIIYNYTSKLCSRSRSLSLLNALI